MLASGTGGKSVPLAMGLRDRSQVARSAVAFGQFWGVSAELSIAKITSMLRFGSISGVRGIFCRSSPPSTSASSVESAMDFVALLH